MPEFLIQMEVAVAAESMEQAVEWMQFMARKLTSNVNVAGVTAVGQITATVDHKEELP